MRRLSKRGLNITELYKQGPRYKSSMNLFPLLSAFLVKISLPDAYMNSLGHISNLLLTHCTWTHLLLACHPHKLRCISARNPCILFTLDTNSIPCYFCFECLIFAAESTCQRSLQINIQHKYCYLIFVIIFIKYSYQI